MILQRYAIPIALVALLMASCSDMPAIQFGSMDDPARPKNFGGLVAGDEPQAVQAAEKILRARGNAADAAVTAGLVLSVTLPSRAGLGAHGACLVRDVKSGAIAALDFATGAEAARGFFALHARYGRLPWAQVVIPAETMARFGAPVSRALARDIAAYGAVLMSDRAAFAQFQTARRQFVGAGDPLTQPTLAETLAHLRARDFVKDPSAAPRWVAAARSELGDSDVYSLPSERVGEGEGGADTVGTGFTIADAEGNLVSCALSMGKPFGAGVMTPGGLFTASTQTPASLTPTVVITRLNGEPRAGLAAAGPAAPERVAALMRHIVKDRRTLADLGSIPTAAEVPPNAPVSAWACAKGLSVDGQACEALADPNGSGYALVITPTP